MQLDSLGGIWLKKGVIDGCAPSRHAGNFNHRLLAAGTHVSREFSERSLLFTVAASQESLDYDLGIGRNVKVHRLTWNQRHGLAAKSASYRKLIGAVGEFADGRQHNGRVYANRDGQWHILLLCFVLPDMFGRVLSGADV